MSLKKPLIVIVDDSSSVRLFFERAIAPLDVDVEMFASADAAFAYLQTNKPDLLFLDIIMPEKDGLTFLQELRHLSLHNDTPTVVISSKDYAQDRVAAKELGVIEFLAKPMSTKAIEELIVRYTTLS